MNLAINLFYIQFIENPQNKFLLHVFQNYLLIKYITNQFFHLVFLILGNVSLNMYRILSEMKTMGF